jgi:hypothetical protein
MRNHYLLAVLLLSLTLLAGCIQVFGGDGTDQPSDDTNSTDNTTDVRSAAGLEVDFRAGRSNYTSGDRATFIVDVTSMGEFRAERINMTLYGANWATEVSDGERRHRSISFLEGANRSGEGGEEARRTFRRDVVTSLSRGEKDRYDVGLRTRYEYSARTRSKLTVMKEDEFREANMSREPMDNEIRSAPIELRFTGRTPWTGGKSDIVVPLTLENVGSGDIQGDVNLTVWIEGGPVLQGCSGEIAVSEDRKNMMCPIRASQIGLGDLPQKNFALIAEATYTYVDDREASVSVTGAR